MERLTKTTAGELVKGDRFYKADDAAKKVWQVLPKETPGNKISAYMSGRNSRYPVGIAKSTEVIFLRHTD